MGASSVDSQLHDLRELYFYYQRQIERFSYGLEVIDCYVDDSVAEEVYQFCHERFYYFAELRDAVGTQIRALGAQKSLTPYL